MKNAYIDSIAKWKVPVIRLDDSLNPFVGAGVDIWMLCGQATNYITLKAGMVLEMLNDASKAGKLKGVTHLVEASSGATALSLGALARDERFGIPDVRVLAVMKKGIPDGKLYPVAYLPGTEVIEPLPGLSAIATARKLGEQAGWLNLGQYENPVNPNSYRVHLAPHVISEMRAHGGIDLFVSPVGTGGTILGLAEGFRQENERIRIIGAMCAEGEEISGMRSESQMKEILHPWREAVDEVVQMRALDSYLAMLQITECTAMMPGASAGATYLAALKALKRHELAGTLDSLRGRDGRIHVLFVAHDGSRTYVGNHIPMLEGQTLFKGPKVWTRLEEFQTK